MLAKNAIMTGCRVPQRPQAHHSPGLSTSQVFGERWPSRGGSECGRQRTGQEAEVTAPWLSSEGFSTTRGPCGPWSPPKPFSYPHPPCSCHLPAFPRPHSSTFLPPARAAKQEGKTPPLGSMVLVIPRRGLGPGDHTCASLPLSTPTGLTLLAPLPGSTHAPNAKRTSDSFLQAKESQLLGSSGTREAGKCRAPGSHPTPTLCIVCAFPTRTRSGATWIRVAAAKAT